jgi:hypothetical protein
MWALIRHLPRFRSLRSFAFSSKVPVWTSRGHNRSVSRGYKQRFELMVPIKVWQ